MPEIGNSLREARIRKGLTIKDVEDVTKIRSRYLEALEEDDFEVMPGSDLRSGRSCVRTRPSSSSTGTRWSMSIRRSYETGKEEPGLLRSEAVQQPRSRTVAERKKRRARRSQRGYAIVGVLAVVAVFLLAWFGARGDDPSPPLDSASFSSTATTSGYTDDSTTTTVGGGAAGSTTTSLVVTTGENVEVVLTVTEGSCWLVVREDSAEGAEMFAGTLSAGGSRRRSTARSDTG